MGDNERDPKIHPLALVESGVLVGARTRIWAYAHVLPGVRIGEDCNICDHTFIEGGVSVGDRVTVKCGVYLWSGVTIEDDVFIGPAVAFSNDLKPRSRMHPEKYLPVLLRRGCSIGANATVLPVMIGNWSMVGAGAVVTKDVPDYALVTGNPARIAGWVCRCGEKLPFLAGNPAVACRCGRRFERITETQVRDLTE